MGCFLASKSVFDSLVTKMAMPVWLWKTYEYLCFLLVGFIVAFQDSNPYHRVKRKFLLKLASAPVMREQALSQTDFAKNNTKVAIVTGGNGGIGLETCYFLLRAGYNVIIGAFCSPWYTFFERKGCRSAKAGEEAVEWLKVEAKMVGLSNPSVEIIPLDLSSQESISSFVKEVKRRELAVSLLINNAGVMFVENLKTKEGYEAHFGVNHLGHYKLTVELMEVLVKNGPSRVINVTSDTYAFGKFDLSIAKVRGQNYHRWWAYCDSKLMNLLFTRGLHRKLEIAGLHDCVKVYAVHPGSVSTGITRGAHSLISYLYSLTIVKTIINLQTARDGASGTIYVALSKDVDSKSGEYFATTYHHRVAPNAHKKEEQEDQLIRFSDEQTNTNLERTLSVLSKRF